jgi:hypothetical protein
VLRDISDLVLVALSRGQEQAAAMRSAMNDLMDALSALEARVSALEAQPANPEHARAARDLQSPRREAASLEADSWARIARELTPQRR